MPEQDLFLSYHTPDREIVQEIKWLLEARGVSTFFDRDNLELGLPWPQALESALLNVHGVAVFLGPEGLGLWMRREMNLALDRQVQEEKAHRRFPVIPVLLPGADLMPSFLFQNNGIDLRDDPTNSESINLLAEAVLNKGKNNNAPTKPIGDKFCPYRGLRAFREEDTAFFKGRESFSNQVFSLVNQRNLVAVIGPSGSGKSSVVQAGLVPQLRRQHLPDPTWDTFVFTPGDNPEQRMADALLPLLMPELDEIQQIAQAKKLGKHFAEGKINLEQVVQKILENSGGTDRVLVVVDQFEELFTLTPEARRKPFVDRLLKAINTVDKDALHIIVTLRADFYAQVIGLSRDLSDRLQGGTVNLGPMRTEEMIRAIVEPAQRVGLSFEEGLPAAILEDVGEEPGSLPLMEFALTELWERQQGSQLTWAAYRAIEGVHGAIAKRADAEFLKLNHKEQSIAKHIFTRLVCVANPKEGGRDTRRRVPLKDLESEARPIVNILANSRLLVISEEEGEQDNGKTNGPTVEVTHEALIRQWQCLQDWLNEDRAFFIWRNRLGTVRKNWEDAHCDEGTLLRGRPLQEANEWMQTRSKELDRPDHAFINESIFAEEERVRVEKEKIRQDKLYKRKIWWGTSIAAFALILGGFYVVYQERQEAIYIANQERQEAIKAKNTIKAMNSLTSAWLVSERDPGTSALLLTELNKTNNIPKGGEVAAMRLFDVPKPRYIFNGHKEPVTHLAVSGQECPEKIVTGSEDGHVWLWDMMKGEKKKSLSHPSQVGNGDEAVLDTTISQNCNKFVVATKGRTDDKKNFLRLWIREDIKKTNQGHILKEKFGPIHFDHELEKVILSRNGERVLAILSDKKHTAHNKIVKVLEADSENELFSIKENDEISVTTLTLSPNGDTLAVGGKNGTVTLWRGAHLQHKISLPSNVKEQVNSLAFSATGNHLVAGLSNGVAIVWDLVGLKTSYKGSIVLQSENPSPVRHIAISPDGSLVSLGISDIQLVEVWKIPSRNQLSQKPKIILEGKHKAGITSLSFSHDSRRLVTGSWDNTAIVWSVDGNYHHHVVLRGHHGPVSKVNFMAGSSSTVVTASWDRTVRIWDISRQFPVEGPQYGNVWKVSFSPTGDRVVTLGRRGIAQIWQKGEGKQFTILRDLEMNGGEKITAVSFDINGELVVTGSDQGNVHLWNILDKSPSQPLGTHDRDIVSIAISPDIKWVVSGDSTGTLGAWLIQKPSQSHRFNVHEGGIYDLAFSKTGKLVTGSWDGTVRIWNLNEDHTSSIKLSGNGDGATAVAISQDGSQIAMGSWDGWVELWKVQKNRSWSKQWEKRFQVQVNDLAISPNGLKLAGGLLNGLVWVWDNRNQKYDELWGHASIVNNISFNKKSDKLVSASWDGTARVWSLNSYSEPLVIRGDRTGVIGADFNENDSQVILGSYSGVLRGSPIDWEGLIADMRMSVNTCLLPEQRQKYLGEDNLKEQTNSEKCTT